MCEPERGNKLPNRAAERGGATLEGGEPQRHSPEMKHSVCQRELQSRPVSGFLSEEILI